MFVPLAHPPGHAQADFGEAVVVIGGVEQKAHFFVMDLPHSDACFVRAYPAATAEAWVDGHLHAFAFFGKVPASVLYDNDRCLVAKILPDGTRQRATLFSGFLSHYLFRDRYGRPGKGNDKGNVEGLVGYSRRNFMVPIPRFATWDAFNGYLEDQCLKRQADVLRGQAVEPGARIITDGWLGYENPPANTHEAKVVTGKKAHEILHWVHRVFFNLKRWAKGVFHGLRKRHLQRYLDEFVFRWNRRRHMRGAFDTLLGIGVGLAPATYRDFVEQRV
jgi:hypothetical protein